MNSRPWPFFLFSALVLFLDQATKFVVLRTIAPFSAIRVTSFFNIVYVENTGSAFGLFKSLGNIFFIAAAAAAILVVSVLMVKDRDGRFAFSLILGGAAGNLADRLVHGYVIDFLDFHMGSSHWPAFNVADSALTLGIVLLAVATLWPAKDPAN